MKIEHTLVCLLALLWVSTSSQNSTTNCGPNCQLCSQPDPSHCFQCDIAYYLPTTLQCSACQPGCGLCKGPIQCISCNLGYLLQNGTCLECPSSCLQCSSIKTTTVTTCTQCNFGFYLQTTALDEDAADYVDQKTYQACAPCMPSCLTCNSSDSCQECAYGFGFNFTASECYACAELCTDCNSEDGCTACLQGYYPMVNGSMGQCVECAEHCQQCNGEGECEKCATGFFPDGLDCTPCTEPCRSCFNQTLCLSCEGGYFLYQHAVNSTSLLTTCVPCLRDCVSCQDGNYCSQCGKGFYASDNQTCQSCGNACEECSGTGECSSCSGSFYLRQGKCQQCPDQCTYCTADASQSIYCYNCSNSSYIAVEGSCRLCHDILEGCSTCEPQGNCISCLTGYILYDGQCSTQDGGLATVYIVLICIAALIGVGAIAFGIWACWRSRNGYGIMGEGSNEGGVRASYYEIP